MNKITTLAIISIVTAGFAAAAPANAGPMEGSARFNFQPNTWGAEKAPKPFMRATTPVHAVRSGMVPRAGASFLGVDPSMLTKPAPPPAPVQMNVAATPSFGTATPLVSAPAKFNTAFGTPLTPAPPAPVVAHVPPAITPIPQVAKAAPAMQVKPQGKPVVHTNSGVSGKVLAHHPKKSPVGLAANPGPPVAGYGDMGYKPGGFNPASVGGGTSSSGNVYGKILH